MTPLGFRKTSSRKAKNRIKHIVSVLSVMSRDGWEHSRPADYQALEAELAALRGAR
jgi:hypothetical protein